jgi:hypothetical protein
MRKRQCTIILIRRLDKNVGPTNREEPTISIRPLTDSYSKGATRAKYINKTTD